MMPASFFFEFWSRGGAGFVRAMGPIATEYGGFGKEVMITLSIHEPRFM